jgi:ABC-type Fe3+ transport system substrate-binding protein
VGSKVRSFTLPADAQAVAPYPIAAVRGSRHLTVARQFVEFVLTARAQRLLAQAGFGSPPGS